MSVGGYVTRITKARKGVLRVHTKERQNPRDSETCVCVADTAQTQCISEGDSFWWQGKKCYWTHLPNGKEDVPIDRIGHSHEAPEESAVKNALEDIPKLK